MKRSVRWKFTIIFAGLMTVAIALIWCINNWFLSGYYQNYKIHTLEKGYRAIDAIIQDEVRNGESSLEDAQAELNSGWKEYQKSKDGSTTGVKRNQRFYLSFKCESRAEASRRR